MRARQYTLFIDESGRFGERDLEEEQRRGEPSSQICGILLPGVFTRRNGDDLPQSLLRLFPVGRQDHATETSRGERAAMVERVIRLTRTNQWRLVRLVNNSGIGEGDVSTTYTRMVAELIVCLYQTLCDEAQTEQPVINLMYAQVMLGKKYRGRAYYFSRGEVIGAIEREGSPIMIEPLEYAEAIHRELRIDLRHGLGLSEEGVSSILGKVMSASGRINPALRLSDLVSNGTYRRGRALRDHSGLRAELLELIEPYDYELHPLKPVHLAEDLARHRALGQAIVFVIDHLAHRQLGEVARQRLTETLDELIEDLSEEHSEERASDLRAILDALEDWVDRRRDFSVAEDVIQVLEDQVFPRLAQQLEKRGERKQMDWALFRLLNLALKNANHNGQLKLAYQRRQELEKLRPNINHRWDELQTIMNSQLNIASSCADTLDFQHGLELAEEVGGFYQDLSEMVGAFRGQHLLSSELKIEEQADALGCTLMLERYLCLERVAEGDPIDSLVDRGRELGHKALQLFSTREDQMRTHQQLAHLEAISGEFSAAWRHLILGADGEVNTQQNVSVLRQQCVHALKLLPDDELLFPMFHVLRLISLELIADHCSPQDEMIEELVQVMRSRCQDLLSGEIDDYPAHAILRSWATVSALRGDDASAIGAIRSLYRLVDERGTGDALHLITLSAVVETAVSLARCGQTNRARSLLTEQMKLSGSKRAQSFASRTAWILKRVEGTVHLEQWLAHLSEGVQEWVTEPNKEKGISLLRIAARYAG